MTRVVDYSEVDAMRDVDTALSKLTSDFDAQRRVIQWLASKYLTTTQVAEGFQINSPVLPNLTERPLDIKSFMAQKRPANHYERVACLAYYLEKFKEMRDVGAKDIVEANTEARLPKMSNPAVFIKHATHTYGYLNSIGQRRLVLSSRGEAIVEALPDRSNVEEALANFSFGRKAKTGKKSKKKPANHTD